MLEFCDDDWGYLSWVADHPEGFVLNVREKSDRDYVVLHRASCGSISSTSPEPGAYTERAYRKICATSVDDLRIAARREGRIDGSFSKACSWCRPTESLAEPSGEQSMKSASSSHAPSFEVKLGKAYWRQGFFNVGVAFERYFGKHNSRVAIMLGGSKDQVVAHINRTANSNQTPRIMGGAVVKEWFHRNASPGASIKVEVLTSDRIRLSALS